MSKSRIAMALVAALFAIFVPSAAFAVDPIAASPIYMYQDSLPSHLTKGYISTNDLAVFVDCEACHGTFIDPSVTPTDTPAFLFYPRFTKESVDATTVIEGNSYVAKWDSAFSMTQFGADGFNPDSYNLYLNGVLVDTVAPKNVIGPGNIILPEAYTFNDLASGDSTIGIQAIWSKYGNATSAVNEIVVHNNTPVIVPKTGSVTLKFDKTTVVYGGTFTVTGTAYKNGVVATSGLVDLAKYESDGAGSGYGFVVTDVPVNSLGQFTVTYKPTKNDKFAIRFKDEDVSNQSVVFGATNVVVKPYASAVAGNSSTIYRNKTYSFYGYVNPRTSMSLKVYKYNTTTKKYVYYKTVAASVGTTKYSAGYKGIAKWKPTVAGKYRLNWATGTPSGLTASTSAVRYLTVK